MKITIRIRPKNLYDKFIHRLDPKVHEAKVGETCFFLDWSESDEKSNDVAIDALVDANRMESRLERWMLHSKGPMRNFDWRNHCLPSSSCYVIPALANSKNRKRYE
jgi:hypothetical protein